MAVAALLYLKHERTLPLERSRAMYVLVGHWIAAPGVHVRTPRCELGEASKRAERDRDHEHRDYCNRTALPALFSFSRKKRQKNQTNNYQGRADEKEWRLKRWREK